jgi:hypothetical protein
MTGELIAHFRFAIVLILVDWTWRDALHFFDSLADYLMEFYRLSLRWPVARRKLVRQRLAANQDGAEHLGNGVVQFEGHAPALGFLHLHHAMRQGPQNFLVAPGFSQTTRPYTARSSPWSVRICARPHHL